MDRQNICFEHLNNYTNQQRLIRTEAAEAEVAILRSQLTDRVNHPIPLNLDGIEAQQKALMKSQEELKVLQAKTAKMGQSSQEVMKTLQKVSRFLTACRSRLQESLEEPRTEIIGDESDMPLQKCGSMLIVKETGDNKGSFANLHAERAS